LQSVTCPPNLAHKEIPRMDFRCIFVLAFLLVSPADGASSNAEVAAATAHKAFPGSVIGFRGRHDPAEWKRNDPDKSAYEPMGGSFRAGDLTPDTPNAEEEPNDIEDKPQRPGGFYAKELAIEKGKAARHESLQGPGDEADEIRHSQKYTNDNLDETFMECDAHPERCKGEDLEEEAKQKVELESVTVDNIVLDKEDDDDDDDLPKTKLAEFPWIKAHDDHFKNQPVLAAKEVAAENSKARIALDKKLQNAGNPDVKIPVAIDYDKLRAEKSKNYDIDCDGPHGDPKNCQKYDGDDIDIESANEAEFHHMATAWEYAGMANRNKLDPNYVEGFTPSIDFDGYKNFDADMPEVYDDVDSLNKNGALKKAEEIRQEDNVGGHGIDTAEETTHNKKEAARLAMAHKKKLPKPTQAEKFAIAEKIKLAEAQDAEDTAQKDTEKKKKDKTTGEHKKKLAEKKREKKGKHAETWSDKFKAYLPWSKSSNDQVAKKTKKEKTNTEKLRR